MIEKIKSVHNPLTIIAIFAALAEIAGTIALATVSEQQQNIFIWFVMLFPTFLVSCFFLTLNFNPKVLYAPSDFRDEENFLNILNGTRKVTSNLKTIDNNIKNLRGEIHSQKLNEEKIELESNHQKLMDLLEQELLSLQNQIEKTRESAEDISSDLSLGEYPRSSLQAEILHFLSKTEEPIDVEELSNFVGRSQKSILRALERLENRGIVETVPILESGDFEKMCVQLSKSKQEKK